MYANLREIAAICNKQQDTVLESLWTSYAWHQFYWQHMNTDMPVCFEQPAIPTGTMVNLTMIPLSALMVQIACICLNLDSGMILLAPITWHLFVKLVSMFNIQMFGPKKQSDFLNLSSVVCSGQNGWHTATLHCIAPAMCIFTVQSLGWTSTQLFFELLKWPTHWEFVAFEMSAKCFDCVQNDFWTMSLYFRLSDDDYMHHHDTWSAGSFYDIPNIFFHFENLSSLCTDKLYSQLLSDCPDGYSAFGQSCYKMPKIDPSDKTDWYTARDACIADNGYLVRLDDAAENRLVDLLSR